MYQKALCSLEVGNAPAGNQSASLIRMALIFALDHCIEAPNGANETGGELDSGNDGFGNAWAADYENDNAKHPLAFSRPE